MINNLEISQMIEVHKTDCRCQVKNVGTMSSLRTT